MTEAWADNLTESLAAVSDRANADPYDAIVVGGGTAGVVAAVSLLERELSVALLEAGAWPLLTHVDSTDLRFQTGAGQAVRATLEYHPLHAASGQPFGLLIRALGGRGLFWNGATPRMRAHELVRWPLELADLEPHYSWMEEHFRVTTDYGQSGFSQRLFEPLGQAGFAVEALPWSIDVHATAATWLAGGIGNASALVLRHAQLAPPEERRLTIALESFVDRVLLNTQGQAAGVISGDHEIRGRAVVLAGGAYESVRLAQVSGVADPGGRLGSHLLDHAYVRLYAELPDGLYGPEPEVALGLYPSASDRPYQIELHAPRELLFAGRESEWWAPGDAPGYQLRLRSFAPIRGGADSHIEPAGSGPGAYRVHLDHGAVGQVLAEQATATMRAMVDRIGAQEVDFDHFPPGGSFHEAGGLGMGLEPTDSVTDPLGRFHQVANLVGVDAAVWPDIGAANPHLSIGAVARRNASALAEALS